jgi:hypothetical protein
LASTAHRKVADLAKALKKTNDASEEEKKKGISLSGLLNAIDGVASHEAASSTWLPTSPRS